MSNEQTQLAPYPVVLITIGEDHAEIDGKPIDTAGRSMHRAATDTVRDTFAADLGRPVRVIAADHAGKNRLVVHPDGKVTDIEPITEDQADEDLRAAWHWAEQKDTPSESFNPFEQAVAGLGHEPAVASSTSTKPSVDDPSPQEAAPRHHARKSFIANEAAIEPARTGWRGAMTRIGIRTPPSKTELEFREDVRQVSQHWPGPRTIAIANPKGSANKTPTMVCLSAIFGRYGGAGVLGWDNNETRGTAAWRTRRGPHDATVLDLLPRWQELLGSGAQAAQLAHYVHHQPADKFDVLWSDQSTASEHEMTGEEVQAIHEVAAKYYRLIFMDSGNSERASNWRAMIQAADQLVMPCTNVEDTAEAGARMLEALAERDEHFAKLARNAVAIVSQRTPGKDADMDRIIKDLAPLVRKVVKIPHDPGLYSGVINFDGLRGRTQRAWLAAGAAVSKGF